LGQFGCDATDAAKMKNTRKNAEIRVRGKPMTTRRSGAKTLP
jgi:hypothetical protein